MRIGLFLILLLCAQGSPAATDPRRALAEGERAFIRTNMTEAASLFSTAAVQAAATKLDPAVAHYNQGLALLAGGQAAEAAEQFQAATRTIDLDLQQKALFNRGNALCQQAADLEKASQLQPALQSVNEAQAMYEKALMLAPRDRDAKVNYELAGRARERLEQMQPPPQSSGQGQDPDDQKDQQEKEEEQPSESSQDTAPDKKPEQPESGDADQQQQQETSPTPAGDQEQKPEEEEQARSNQEMTREEAAQLLDGMKEQEQASREQMARDRMRMNMGRLPPVDKDW